MSIFKKQTADTQQRVSKQRGITLIEILISLVIGLIIVGGVWTLLVNSRASFSTSQNQAVMLDSARFALHAIGRDLKLAGGFGPMNEWRLIGTSGVDGTLAGNDCEDGFYADVAMRVFGTDNVNPYPLSSCIGSYLPGTDVLVVRYADPTPISDDETDESGNVNAVFIHSYHSRGELFFGGDPVPTFGVHNGIADMVSGNPVFNYRLVTNIYYISPDSEEVVGVPSLRRVSLVPGSDGPQMEDQMLVSGIQDLQVQFGVNGCNQQVCPQTINRYIDGGNTEFGGTIWTNFTLASQIEAVRVWLLARSETPESGLNTTGSFFLGSKRENVTVNDSIRREVYSGVFNIRNASGS